MKSKYICVVFVYKMCVKITFFFIKRCFVEYLKSACVVYKLSFA
jgi:hypothetical protein